MFAKEIINRMFRRAETKALPVGAAFPVHDHERLTIQRGCEHPVGERVKAATMSDPHAWLCATCGHHEHSVITKEG